MGNINWLDMVGTLASVVMAVGVVFAWWEIRLTQRQALTAFEDDFGREYREIIRQIPVKALLRADLDEVEFKEAREQVKAQAGDTFMELQRLERSGFKEDPLSWRQA